MRIALWKETAPYTEYSSEQSQPSVESFEIPGSRGAIIVCPGGAYMVKAPHEGAPIAHMLNDAGISAYVLDYRVDPCHYLAPLSDAQRALRLVHSFGYEKVGILGFSAGGNLTCNAAVHFDLGNPESDDPIERLSSKPDAFVSCYSVVSMDRYRNVQSIGHLLRNHTEDESLIRFFSAEYHVTENTPPAFIWHTAEDSVVPVQNSLLLAKALADHGVGFEMHVFPKGEHGLGLAEDMMDVSRWSQFCVEWLKNNGF